MALAAWVALVASLWATLAGELSWQTDGFRLAVNTNGALAGITRRSDGKDVLAPGGPAYLLSLRNGGSFHASERAEWDAVSGRLTLHYAKLGATARVTIVPHPTHLTLELVEVQPAGSADAAQWGPFPTALRQTVGEVVGVVRDGGFALGLQALNPKTLGGVPENDEGNADRPYAAQATASGSVLQAYSLDRSRPRSLAVWGKRAPNMPVAPIPGETVVGSKIALFGCAETDALATIGRIEVAEGLPHPLINGVWAKVSPERGRSYLIADYSEADIDELLGYVKRANLMSLYHGNLFKSWGHYEPNPKFFPNGEAGV
jgi:hypothetical protein